MLLMRTGVELLALPTIVHATARTSKNHSLASLQQAIALLVLFIAKYSVTLLLNEH